MWLDLDVFSKFIFHGLLLKEIGPGALIPAVKLEAVPTCGALAVAVDALPAVGTACLATLCLLLEEVVLLGVSSGGTGDV